ncbi:mannose-1-phosphate guanylyltransferase/mannose-6-phosphate isomerase [Aeromonas simiae]|uniref:mannose-1-phosphate guanylyltransferase/mannose-6-phosphate isomerase n=1 Tax=Aeromonas simiae TaxID=218936 RepID=UPI0012EE6226|nr:mannose-1-phosphate guanylyltransferase/mannose-6-phosphate isomerase [Aeromonas simiae]MDO2948068.1 mannose-1-phosphate guanylyltransferase/mannose-6-phosphate isomerase [Aeromonas simiae]MDO2953100.1 mannose-1-phosphate guanylyltransferase/mannose-6-phosphate isomerase [Aeromonas simiae]MDO2955513.1 mannose-1-phosphate guanylyltransferase/mannose-6-phosphate isomerase [Aeromonas simiae]
MTILPVIMAGGSGSRLWPLSRGAYPKQFLRLCGEHTMLQETLRRLHGLPCAAPLVICNEEHRFVVAEQLRELGQLAGNIILEPVGRNTAPAIALAALAAIESGEDPLLLVLAADHVITDPQAFSQSVRAAMPLAASGHLVTFGIVPTGPETGYGYLRRGEQIGAGYRVRQFVEKPDRARAEAYLACGEYAWNSGMFLMRASHYLEELTRFAPAIAAACRAAMVGTTRDLDFVRVDGSAFGACPSDSIDYAVMEHTECALMVPMEAGWCDVGSWSSLWEISEKDGAGNVARGDVLLQGSHNSYVHADSGLVTLVGVDDLIVIQTKDAVLVAHRDQVQEVKQVVERLKQSGRREFHEHREHYRPWGKIDTIDQGGRYQVKHITVKPGEQLSLQMHHHRAEHWVVVSGTARVTLGEEVRLIGENQSVYIPIGAVHSLENPGRIPLHLIEVQSGGYFGDDDIIRFNDRYGRT